MQTRAAEHRLHWPPRNRVGATDGKRLALGCLDQPLIPRLNEVFEAVWGLFA